MKRYNYKENDIKAVYSIYPNCEIVILDILCGIEDNIITAYYYNGVLHVVRENKLYTTKAGRSYFRKGKRRYYLEDFNILL